MERLKAAILFLSLVDLTGSAQATEARILYNPSKQVLIVTTLGSVAEISKHEPLFRDLDFEEVSKLTSLDDVEHALNISVLGSSDIAADVASNISTLRKKYPQYLEKVGIPNFKGGTLDLQRCLTDLGAFGRETTMLQSLRATASKIISQQGDKQLEPVLCLFIAGLQFLRPNYELKPQVIEEDGVKLFVLNADGFSEYFRKFFKLLSFETSAICKTATLLADGIIPGTQNSVSIFVVTLSDGSLVGVDAWNRRFSIYKNLDELKANYSAKEVIVK